MGAGLRNAEMQFAPSEGEELMSWAQVQLPTTGIASLQDLVRILQAADITSPSDLAVLSRRVLEEEFGPPKNSVGKLANILKLQKAAQQEENKQSEGRRGRGRGRSRSPRPRRRNGSRPPRNQSRPQGRANDQEGASTREPSASKPDLWAAIEAGEQQQVQHLLDTGADVEEKFKSWSPLMKAAEEGHVVILQALIEIRANLEEANHKGRTALSFAAAPSKPRASHPDAVHALLYAGADRSVKDKTGRTAQERVASEQPENHVATLAVFEEFLQQDPNRPSM